MPAEAVLMHPREEDDRVAGRGGVEDRLRRLAGTDLMLGCGGDARDGGRRHDPR